MYVLNDQAGKSLAIVFNGSILSKSGVHIAFAINNSIIMAQIICAYDLLGYAHDPHWPNETVFEIPRIVKVPPAEYVQSLKDLLCIH